MQRFKGEGARVFNVPVFIYLVLYLAKKHSMRLLQDPHHPRGSFGASWEYRQRTSRNTERSSMAVLLYTSFRDFWLLVRSNLDFPVWAASGAVTAQVQVQSLPPGWLLSWFLAPDAVTNLIGHREHWCGFSWACRLRCCWSLPNRLSLRTSSQPVQVKGLSWNRHGKHLPHSLHVLVLPLCLLWRA